MMRLLLLVLASLFLGSLGAAHAPSALAAPASVVHIYNYDGHHHSTPLTDTTDDRGPPAGQDRCASHGAFDRPSHGALARPRTATTTGTFTYDRAALLVRADIATAATERAVQKCNGVLASVQQ